MIFKIVSWHFFYIELELFFVNELFYLKSSDKKIYDY